MSREVGESERVKELFARATDPRQYDAPGLDWPQEGAHDTPAARFFRRALREELRGIRGAAVIDIGAGTGHLFELLRELGARRVVALEPSGRSAALARARYPELEVVEQSLDQSPFDAEFERAVAVMSFEHQADLRRAFRAVRRLLRPAGELYLIFGDSRFHVTPRFDVTFEIHALDDGSAVVVTQRPYGTLYDVIRPPAHYADAARAEGFHIRLERELPPGPELFQSDPRWRTLEGRPVARLLIAVSAEAETAGSPESP